MRFYKYLVKSVVAETRNLKRPFFDQRVQSLKKVATRENLQQLQTKGRFLSRESQDSLRDAKFYWNSIQNQELCQLILKHKLIKRPQMKKERVSSQDEEELGEVDNSMMGKNYYMKMAELYN
mmetsp:Transcript_46872/g.34304  ORF Transcript_46872/g.34304 Transcript_46872/m.34304 type:complete len:122 (-) Transcript_46872:897-1262(-)